MAISFTTFEDVKRFNADISFSEQLIIKSKILGNSSKNTFLSHSSKDAEYLPGIIRLLENHGASVYCDLDDKRLPDRPSPETALTIKNQIKASKRQVIFVTVNSKDSKWVPWELGVGDVQLGINNIALLPVSNHSYEQDWAKQEYLGLYRHIMYGGMQGEPKPLWMLYDYRNNTATKLSDWCRG